MQNPRCWQAGPVCAALRIFLFIYMSFNDDLNGQAGCEKSVAVIVTLCRLIRHRRDKFSKETSENLRLVTENQIVIASGDILLVINLQIRFLLFILEIKVVDSQI